jgi:hypothetical protein
MRRQLQCGSNINYKWDSKDSLSKFWESAADFAIAMGWMFQSNIKKTVGKTIAVSTLSLSRHIGCIHTE